MQQRPRTRPLASRTRVLLAVLFGLIASGVVGMHLLSADHQLAAPDSSHHAESLTVVTHDGHHATAVVSAGSAAASFVGPTGAEPGCAGCDQHLIMVGSCVLVMVFGLLWRILAPNRGRSWPLLERTTAVSSVLAPSMRPPRRASLTHLDLSISRT